ncbi:Cationic amino acid transporter 4 [Cichlidogyrus casuarinus]|uniref:Cationic amino acid transporter 4 n=1 Tax=Cichlidogyrus casuarinus TaxID=1844966 RepID=A0ABD2Q5W3_9PLAT
MDQSQPLYRCLSGKEVRRRMIRRRALDKDMSLRTQLNRCLGYPELTAYGLAHTIGVGLYVLTGTLVKNYAGASTCFAYLIAGISGLFTGACYAEFSTLVPRAGSSYVYTYLMLGELPAFLIGWTMISDMIVGMSAISKALSGTINLMCGGCISNWSSTHLVTLAGGKSEILERNPDLISCAFIILLVLITLTGVKFSLGFNFFIAILQMSFLIIMIICAFVFGNPANITNDTFAPGGLIGILNSVGIGLFAFSGFESLTTASEEARDPKKDLPRALYTSSGICVVLYFIVPIALNYLTPRGVIDIYAPFPSAFDAVGVRGLMWFAAIATIIASGAAKIVGMHCIPRMFYSMASDGLLFSFMGYVDPYTRVPIFSLLIGGTICALLALFINLKALADFTSVGIIFCYYFIGIDLIVLRYIYNKEDSDMSNLKFTFILFVLSLLFVGASVKGVIVWYEASVFFFITMAFFGLVSICCFAVLCIYKPNVYEGGFVVSTF